MDKLSRYLFILLCLIVFLILAPLIVLYVSGTRFNFSDREYEPTGIFTAKTEPDNAEVIVDDRSPEKSPATIRFLSQGQYSITIRKDGYFDWSKRLQIEPNQVTYAHFGVDAIHLIKKPVPEILVDAAVTDFISLNDTIWYSTSNAIGKKNLNDTAAQTFPVPFTPQGLALIPDTTSLLAEGEGGKKFIFDTSDQTVMVLPSQFNSAQDIHLPADNLVFAKIDNILFSYNLDNKTLVPLLNNLVGFTMSGNNVYVAHQENNAVALQIMSWTPAGFSEASALIKETLPDTDDVQLIITPRRELFALSNETLYRVNTALETVGSHVITAELDPITNELSFRTPSELWFYNFISSRPQILTRSTENIHTFTIRSVLGYGIIAGPTGLTLMEIDSRDRQNKYEILSGKPVWTATLSSNQKSLIALQNNQLIHIPIK